MFSPTVYQQRRQQLCQQIERGLILFVGHDTIAVNAASYEYPFRQDSSFLYYLGINHAGLNALIDTETDTTCLYGDDTSVEKIVWTGPQPTVSERAAQVGITKTAPTGQLHTDIQEALQQKRSIHILPTYRPDTQLKLQAWFSSHPIEPSPDLIRVVVKQRSVKTEDEVSQIELALDVSAQIHQHAMHATLPGLLEKEIVGALHSIACLSGLRHSFTTIFSVHGETLHNPHYNNILDEGDIVVHDSGVESDLGYASDITRTFPVTGTFTDLQRDLYSIVLDMQTQAIAAVKPGVPYRDIHAQAARVLMQSLNHLGLTQGDVDEAVNAGAHTLFFPHGLGHMLGLDVHDMEPLGADYVGYSDTIQKDERFGWNKLRFARELEEGFVITVEPGLYFIPALIDQWQADNKLADFINYDKVNTYRHARGIRIEDDVLVTKDGHRILGPNIPKTIDDVEAACAS